MAPPSFGTLLFVHKDTCPWQRDSVHVDAFSVSLIFVLSKGPEPRGPLVGTVKKWHLPSGQHNELGLTYE